jgi:hypothetical protein
MTSSRSKWTDCKRKQTSITVSIQYSQFYSSQAFPGNSAILYTSKVLNDERLKARIKINNRIESTTHKIKKLILILDKSEQLKQ